MKYFYHAERLIIQHMQKGKFKGKEKEEGKQREVDNKSNGQTISNNRSDNVCHEQAQDLVQPTFPGKTR